MIGKIVGLYTDGVRDARGGRKRRRLQAESEHDRQFYLLGLRDERARMRLQQRLSQGDLFLGEPRD